MGGKIVSSGLSLYKQEKVILMHRKQYFLAQTARPRVEKTDPKLDRLQHTYVWHLNPDFMY